MSIKQLKIGFLGSLGSYTHQAAEELFPKAKLIGYATIFDIVEATERSEIDRGVVPVENAIAGRVADLYQILDLINLSIVAEHFVEIIHCFAVNNPSDEVLKEGNYDSIEIVHSHKQALMQCRDWTSKNVPQAETISLSDTATSAKVVSEDKTGRKAAICSQRAAEIYGLSVAEKGIQNTEQNYTRFHVLSRKPADPQTVSDESALTTIIFQVQHTPGALLKALNAIAMHGVNVVKLETYMVSGMRTAPTFYIDIAINRYSEMGEKALSDLVDNTTFLKVIGCYSSSQLRNKVSGFLNV